MGHKGCQSCYDWQLKQMVVKKIIDRRPLTPHGGAYFAGKDREKLRC